MSALTAQTLGILLHGLRLRGESYAADAIESLSAEAERLHGPISDTQVKAAKAAYKKAWIHTLDDPMRAALEATREVSGV